MTPHDYVHLSPSGTNKQPPQVGAELHMAQLTHELAEANAERVQLKARVAELEPYQERAITAERKMAQVKNHHLLYIARITDLEKRLERVTHDWMESIAWFGNPNIPPAAKVLGFNLLIHQGGAPGRLPQHVLTDLVPVTLKEIGRKSGLKETATGTNLDLLRHNNLINVVQQRVRNEGGMQPKPKRAAKPKAQPGAPAPEPEPEKDPPPFIIKTYLAPQGPGAPILEPAKIGPLEPSPRAEKHKQRAKEDRADTKQKLDRLKVLEARCPSCGEIDPNKLSLHCHKCGTPTIVAELPDAKRTVTWATPRFKRKEQPHPIDPDGNPLPKPETAHCAASEAAQEELFPAPPAEPAEPMAEDADTSAILAQRQENLASPQQSASSGTVECAAKDRRITNTATLGTNAAHSTVSGAPGSETAQCASSGDGALEAAADLLLAIFGLFDEHIYMRRDGADAKYLTEHAPLTRERLIEHLTGKVTLGGRLAISDLAAASCKRSQAWAWDTDEKDGWQSYHRMEKAAYKLADAGLRPLFIRNPAKEASAHLWVLADRPVDARQGQLACEVIAPELTTMRERYPDPEEKTGGRIRFPLGSYRPKQGPPVPVKVGYVRGPGDMAWCGGTEPRAWAVLTSAISDAAILQDTHIPIVCRDQPPPAKERKAYVPRQGTGGFDFARFNAQNAIETLADWASAGGGKQKCLAPWRNESQPSVCLFPDGGWYDFGDDRYRGRDAFDFWCAREGHYNPDEPEVQDKPDYQAAFRALGWSPGQGRTQEAASGDQLTLLPDDDQWDEA